ncbi:MAG: formate acetyltransferase, partial [Proteobacteria bacterium]|nr:formate acetyltransferase [Pseudomonadota bacterium]
MPSSTSSENKTIPSIERITRLKDAVQNYRPSICTERSLIWTDYNKKSKNKKKPIHIQIAEALRAVLLKKTIHIYPDELIVGNYTSKRVGGSIYPELAGLPMMLDIFKFNKRKTNPLNISNQEIFKLLRIVPFWMFRFLGIKAYRSPVKKIRLLLNQMNAHFYLINESGGVSHFAPDYEKLLKIGTNGIISEADAFQKGVEKGSEEWNFHEGVKISAESLSLFGERYAKRAAQMAGNEPDPARKRELEEIAIVCGNVPKNSARSFYEAIQSLFFAQIALNLESMDNSVCPGRMDSYLYPYYRNDIENASLTRDGAKELIASFAVKLCEIVSVNSEHVIKFHGGLFNGQVVTIGGVDSDGKDSVNELSYIFLEVMDELRMRQPNFHARIHANSPAKYIDRINTILGSGANSPALYNDDVIVETMKKHGYDIKDARNYTAVGCVEPVSQGKSFSSTDAALFNVPIILEMALNQGRRFGSVIRSGDRTKPVAKMNSMKEVKDAFESQLKYQMGKLKLDLQAIELSNRRNHPTPLTSALLEGCLNSGKCSTAGGALYNFSGIQCVAPADTGDALYAIDKAVFIDKVVSLPDLVKQLKLNINDVKLFAYLKGLGKFGNDEAKVDKWTLYVVDQFIKVLNSFGNNTRGGKYVVGLYSVTSHVHWGKITGTLPSGRRKGESFASGISPANGMDKKGPTALLNSINRFDFTEIANGINLNIKFDHHVLRDKQGKAAMGSILKTYFRRGGMQAQVNVLDPKILIQARNNPELYPNLLVRVSGYSAYFNDLTLEMK